MTRTRRDRTAEHRGTRRAFLRGASAGAVVGLAGCQQGSERPETTEEPDDGGTTATDATTADTTREHANASWPLPMYDRRNANVNPAANAGDAAPSLDATVAVPGFEGLRGSVVDGSVVVENTLVAADWSGDVATVDLARLSATRLTSLPPSVVAGGFGGAFVARTYESAELQSATGLGVYALDGTEWWHRAADGGLVSRQVLYARDQLYAAVGPTVRCLDARSGDPLWAVDPLDAAREEFAPRTRQRLDDHDVDWRVVRFAVDAGVLVVKFGAGLTVGLDASDGAYRWHYAVEGPHIALPPVVEDGTVVVARGGPPLVDPPVAAAGLDVRTGEERWTRTAKVGDPAWAASAGLFYESRSRGQNTVARHVDSGEVAWTTAASPLWQAMEDPLNNLIGLTFGGGTSVLTFLRRYLYDDVGDDDATGELRAFDRASGDHRWTKRITGRELASRPLPVADRILLGTRGGEVLVYS